MVDVLRPTGALATTGAKYSPFFLPLTDNGTDGSLNEDYSAGATDAYVQFAADAWITNVSFISGLSSFGQNNSYSNSFFGVSSLTNGLKFAIKNGSGTIIQDLTVSYPLTTTADCLLFGNVPSIIFAIPSTTADNNEALIGIDVNFKSKFGAPLFVGEGSRFVCTLQDNFAGITEFKMSVAGHYV